MSDCERIRGAKVEGTSELVGQNSIVPHQTFNDGPASEALEINEKLDPLGQRQSSGGSEFGGISAELTNHSQKRRAATNLVSKGGIVTKIRIFPNVDIGS